MPIKPRLSCAYICTHFLVPDSNLPFLPGLALSFACPFASSIYLKHISASIFFLVFIRCSRCFSVFFFCLISCRFLTSILDLINDCFNHSLNARCACTFLIDCLLIFEHLLLPLLSFLKL